MLSIVYYRDEETGELRAQIPPFAIDPRAPTVILGWEELPSLSGTSEFGETLTVTPGTPLNGLGTETYSWFMDSEDTGQTGPSFDLQVQHIGRTPSVRVRLSDGRAAIEETLFAPKVEDPTPVLVFPPRIPLADWSVGQIADTPGHLRIAFSAGVEIPEGITLRYSSRLLPAYLLPGTVIATGPVFIDPGTTFDRVVPREIGEEIHTILYWHRTSLDPDETNIDMTENATAGDAVKTITIVDVTTPPAEEFITVGRAEAGGQYGFFDGQGTVTPSQVGDFGFVALAAKPANNSVRVKLMSGGAFVKVKGVDILSVTVEGLPVSLAWRQEYERYETTGLSDATSVFVDNASVRVGQLIEILRDGEAEASGATTPEPPVTGEVGSLGMPNDESRQIAGEVHRAQMLEFMTVGPFSTHIKAGVPTWVMAVAALKGNTSFDNMLVQQTKHLISASGYGARCMNYGQNWYSQAREATAQVMFALIRHVPRIWSRFTSVEKERIALCIDLGDLTARWHASTSRSRKKTLSGGVMITGENPNLDRPWFVNMFAAVCFHMAEGDGFSRANEFANNVSISRLRTQTADHGLTNANRVMRAIGSASNAPSASEVENAVRNWRGHHRSNIGPLSRANVLPFYKDTIEHFSSKQLRANWNGTGIYVNYWKKQKGVVTSGAGSYPFSGIGEAFEYDAKDDGPPRTSATYVQEGITIPIGGLLCAIVGGFWNPNGNTEKALRDRFHKCHQSHMWKCGRGPGWNGGRANRAYESLAHNPDRGAKGGHSELTGFDITDGSYGITGPMSKSYGLSAVQTLWEDVLYPALGG